MVSSPPEAVVNANAALTASVSMTPATVTPTAVTVKRDKDEVMESSEEEESTPAKKPKVEAPVKRKSISAQVEDQTVADFAHRLSFFNFS